MKRIADMFRTAWRMLLEGAIAGMLVAAAFWAGPRQSAQAGDTPAQLQSIGDLSAFMKDELNPAFTDVSYELFQRRANRPGATPSDNLIKALERLQTQSERLARLRTEAMKDGIGFRVHAVQLNTGSRAALEAILTGDWAVGEHWFFHMKATCNACHAQYRDMGP